MGKNKGRSMTAGKCFGPDQKRTYDGPLWCIHKFGDVLITQWIHSKFVLRSYPNLAAIDNMSHVVEQVLTSAIMWLNITNVKGNGQL